MATAASFPETRKAFDPSNHPRMVAAKLAVTAAKVEHQRLRNKSTLIGFSAPSNGLAALWHAESAKNAVYRELRDQWLVQGDQPVAFTRMVDGFVCDAEWMEAAE